MSKHDIPFFIRDPQGINRRDGGDRITDNEMFRLQNLWHSTKGLLYKTFGSTQDVSLAQIPGASKISGIHRHYNPNREKYTLYHCEPDTALLPSPTTDLTFAEITGGDIYNGGAATVLRFCYTFCGMGIEGNYNSSNRAGWVSPGAGSVPAASQVGHQQFTPSSNTKGVRVTVPVFPSGVRSVNVFMAVGSTVEMTYVGTVFTSNGTLDVKRYIAPKAAANDAFGTITLTGGNSGTLKPGTYFVSLAWMTDSGLTDTNTISIFSSNAVLPALSASQSITLGYGQSSITVQHSLASSTNAATTCYVFVGLKQEKESPMVCVGTIKSGEFFSILNIPSSTTAQSHPVTEGVSNSASAPPTVVNSRFFTGISHPGGLLSSFRPGILARKDSVGTITEILPARTLFAYGLLSLTDPMYGTNTQGASTAYTGYIRCVALPFLASRTVYEPMFTYSNGLSHFVNGVDVPWQTDGYVLGQMTRLTNTLLPPYPRFIMNYQGMLMVAGSEAKNQVFVSNALNPQNWAQGGAGLLLRFMSIGDLFGDEVTALGIFSFSPEATNNPRGFAVAFKKHGAWMKDSIDGASYLEQLSGRVGCTAPRSLVQTPVGLAFVGSDGDVYLIRGTGEPRAIGTKIKPLLEHLSKDDSLMNKVTAVFHDYHYKVSYPSSSTSTYNDAEVWADMRISDGSPLNWSGPHLGGNVGAQIVLVGESDDLSRIGCRSDGQGTVKLDDVTTFQHLGQPIVSVVETKTYRFKAEMNLKRFTSALIDAYYDTAFTNNVLVEAFVDDQYTQVNKSLSSGAAVWDGSAYDSSQWGDALYQAIRAMFGSDNLTGRTIKLRITHSDNAQFIIAALGLVYQPEKRTIL